MNRAAIITIVDNSNYGNRLQNYAMYKVLSKLGLNSVTLWDKNEISIKSKVKSIVRNILSINNIHRQKYISFQKFTSRMICNEYVDLNNLEEINNKFNYFIVGSDQIWNYNFGHAKDKDFLKFVDYNKTISYAPSFGIYNIDDKWKKRILMV